MSCNTYDATGYWISKLMFQNYTTRGHFCSTHVKGVPWMKILNKVLNIVCNLISLKFPDGYRFVPQTSLVINKTKGTLVHERERFPVFSVQFEIPNTQQGISGIDNLRFSPGLGSKGAPSAWSPKTDPPSLSVGHTMASELCFCSPHLGHTINYSLLGA